MTIGGGGDGEVNIEIDMKKPFDLGNIVKVKNIRVAAFPDFIMDWVARQTDEIINKFFSLPNLIVIPPTDLGPNFSVDGTLGSYGKAFNDASEKYSLKALESQMKWTFNDTKVAEQYTKKTTSKSSLSAPYEKWLDKTVSENSKTINSVQGSANALKAAYKYIGQVPFLRISESAVNVNVPWPLPQELDKYMRSLEQYSTEIKNLKKNWCDGKADAACLDKQTSINLSKFQSSLEANLKIIDTYRNFPQKIQKYVTWRQKYAAWALCNIETIQLFTGKWLKDNGVRFQKWAEFYVLMKAIVNSWQPIIDIFKNADALCGVCQNQRYTLDYWKFKLLSMLIPTLPVITFPKWPDIVLDLSDFRFAINVEVPNFTFNIMPIRLPNLPSLSLPSAPSLGLTFPALPLLPQIPNLPDLPELPSLPKISLPPLPPPPKLPKLFGAIAVVTNLVKLYQTVKCLYQNSILVPEWQAGDVIAQRTARQGTLPFDFLNLQFPQFSIPGIKEIRVQTHVNLELKSDFITEFARTAVKPINEFNTDLQFAMPKKLIDDISIQTPKNIDINLQGFLDESATSWALMKRLASTIEEYGRTSLDIDEFIPFFRSELIESGQSTLELDAALRAARLEAETLIRETEDENAKNIQLFKEYIEAEEAKTKELEKLIEKLQDPTSFLTYSDSLPLANYVSSAPDLVTERRSLFLGQDRTLLTDILEATPDTGKLDRELISFQNRFSRIARSDLGTPDLLVGDRWLESQYTPKFEGIYILTPSGYQTRLFDYIEPLMGGETAEVLDLDGDNKEDDYLYMIDGNLYIKLNPNDSPVRQKDTTLIIWDLDPTQAPEAPNFFDGVVARPGQIDLDFSPARSEDRVFRLEFFDRYSEWELIDIDAHDEELVPRSVVDIMVDDESRITETDGIMIVPMERSLVTVSDPETFTLEWPALTTLSAPTAFTLTAGRPLYTGPTQTRISYTTLTLSWTLKTLTLKPYTRYTFDEALSGSLTSGKLYFFDALSDESMPYDEGMRGMPLLDGMILSSTGWSFTLRDVWRDEIFRIAPGGEYQFMILPYRDDSYTLNIPYKNGFYSARLRSLDSSVQAGVTLLAPQESLDQSPPLVELDDTLRIPVYQSRIYSLSGILRDQSPVTLSIDPDITQDENRDGISDNDFSQSGSTFFLTGDTLRFGSFDTLDRHTLLLRASDMYLNFTLVPLILEIYAPTPEIEGFTATGHLYGSVENEPTEPVHFFRIRGGSPIDLISPQSIRTNQDGVFSTGSLLTGSGVRFSYSGGVIFIDQNTGTPEWMGTLLSIDTLPATGTTPMRMRYKNSRGQYLFEQFLTLPVSTRITLSGAILSGDGPEIVISALEGARTVSATLRDPNIPGGMYITDRNYLPYAALARDGNIYALDPNIVLDTMVEWGYLTLEIKKSGIPLARIQYRVDFFYTLQ
jgi:hypothetical protein